MRPSILWSLCVALLVLLVAGTWLLPSPAAQARPQRLVIDTPTSVPPSATAAPPTNTAVPGVPTNTATAVVPTNTAIPGVSTNTATAVVPTNTAVPGVPTNTATAVGPTGTASSPDSTATPRATRVPAPGAELHISKSASTAEGGPGDFVTFTLTASNDGEGTATDVTISDTLPDFLEVYNVKTTKGVASNQGQRVTVLLDTLDPGESVDVTILARIRSSATAQDGSNIAVIERPNGERVTSERVRIVVRLDIGDTPTVTAPAGTPLAGTPLAGITVMTPQALPVTNAGDGGLEAMVLLFAVGLLIVSAGWALLGVRRR